MSDQHPPPSSAPDGHEPNLADGHPMLADAAGALIRGRLNGLGTWAVEMVRDHINAAFRDGYQRGYNDCLRDKDTP